MTATEEEVYNVPRGTAYLTSQQVLVYGTYLVFYVVLARILSKTEVGQVAVLLLIQALFAGIISGSLPLAATRFISRSIAAKNIENAAGVARVILRLSLAIATPVLAFTIFFTPTIARFLVDFTDPIGLLVTTFVASFFLDLLLLYTAFFLGAGRYAQTLYQNILYVPLSRGLGLALAFYQFKVLGIVLGWAIGAATTVALSVYLWHGQLPKGRSYPLKPILAFALPVFVSGLITLGQQWGDIGIIYVLLGATTVGSYYYAVSSVSFLSILWMPVNQAIYPSLSASHASGNHQEASDRLAVSFRLINLTVLPISAALAAVAPTALEAVYGSQYRAEGLAFAILCISSIFVAQSLLLITTLQAVGHTRQYLTITLVSTLIFIGFVALLTPSLNTLAGAFGRALLALLTVLMAAFSLRKTFDTHVYSAMSKALPLAVGV